MRRLTIVLLAVVSALTLISFAAIAAGAQTETTDQYVTEETTAQEESTTPPPEETSGEPYHQVVDNATAGSFEAPGWQTGRANASTVGADYAYTDSSAGAGPARFTVDVPETGHYVIFARWPGGQDVTTAARFGVETTSGVQWNEADQQADAGLWDLIGIYEMEQGQRTVEVSGSASDGGRVMADAVMITGGVVPVDEHFASGVNPDELAGDLTAEDGYVSAEGGGWNGRDVARLSKKHIGTPYESSPPGRCRAYKAEDCSCHTKVVFRRFDRKLPDRGPDDQWKFGRRVKRGDIKRGDLVFWDDDNNGRLGDFDLVSIYVGGGDVVFAQHGKRVVMMPMNWLSHYYGAKRIRV